MRRRSLLWSFNYAIEGVVYALRTQRNMRLHALAALLVLGASLFLQISRLELIALLFAIVFVFVAELVNTAIEAAVDVATQSFDPIAKVAKDVAAGAVLIAAGNAVIVGYIVFFEPLTEAGEHLLARMRQMPMHVTIVALLLTSLAVLIVKALTQKGTYMRGGWPSGHTAMAVAAATAIGYLTQRAEAAALALFIAFLVAQSRVENGAHSWMQVLSGAVLGFLITTLVFQVSWS